MNAPENPYAPPVADVVDAPSPLAPDVEQLRRDHVRHERALRSIGSLYWLSALMMALATVGTVTFGSLDHRPTPTTILVALLL